MLRNVSVLPNAHAPGHGGDVTDATGSDLSVVLVEDDERLATLTARYLRSHGVLVHVVTRGDAAEREVLALRPDVVLLDLSLPGVDGLEVCRRLRQKVDTPIVMVTARDEEVDRVLGLEGGADDYVTKPFSPRELLARVRAQARRARGKVGPGPARIRVGALEVDTGTRSASLSGQEITLTTYEFDLLRALAERAGRVLTRETLMTLVRGAPDEAFERTVDVHVSRLRQKLGDDPRNPRWLKTIRGVGYALVDGADGAG
ncbi:MAG: response regulator transcription factor [Sandaracinaceae bacterium]|nr:response regulator transcription factor [Myxococcales bacterium]MCB9661537.1 response regulator transcription factor [Sandaracinaceae bacterium]